MNEETPALTQAPPTGGPSQPTDQSPAAGPPSADRVPRAAAWPALLAVLALAAAGVAGWQAWEMRQRAGDMREELASRLAASDTVATEARALARQQQEALAGVQGKLGALESKLAATEGQAAALESLYQEFSRSREDRVVAEVEQAVNVAAQQLQLAGNIEAALIALQGAEARLAALDRGQLAPLRRALARDIEQLRTQPQVDVPGIALRLESLLERVDSLPLAFAGESEAAPTQPAAPADGAVDETSPLDVARRIARDVWEEIKSLVRIERLDRPEPVLLAPAQTTYLRENLKIRLLTARLALLARDGRTFSADLRQAREWLGRYFDQRDERVAAAITELEALAGTSVAAELPNLVESFAAIRMLQTRAGELPAGGQGAAPVESEGAGAATGDGPAAPPVR